MTSTGPNLRPAATTFIRKVNQWKSKATSWVRTHKLTASASAEPYKHVPSATVNAPAPATSHNPNMETYEPLKCIYAQLEDDDDYVFEMSKDVHTAYKRVDQKVKPVPGVFPESARVH